jgi:hypothetical protein
MEPITLAALAAAGLLALSGGKKSGGSYVPVEKFRARSREDRVKYLREIRSMSGWYSNTFDSMPYLADYLTVVAYIESRFNPAAANPEIKRNPMNAARGLFGQRPQFMFKEENGLEALKNRPNLIHNPKWAFVTAVFHIWDADQTSIRRANREADWAGVRRWWGYPSKIYDYDLLEDFSQRSLSKFQNGIDGVNEEYGTGIDPNFIWRPVESAGYPGMDAMIKAFGLKKP